MEVADNLDRLKISDEFEFGRDRTIHFGVTCPWVPKKTNIFYFVRSIACIIFIQSLWNLQINRTGKNYLKSLKLARPHCTIYFGVTCPWLLACWVSGEWLLPIGLLVFNWLYNLRSHPNYGSGYMHCHLFGSFGAEDSGNIAMFWARHHPSCTVKLQGFWFHSQTGRINFRFTCQIWAGLLASL